MRWSEPGLETAFARLVGRFAAAAWDAPPPGFAALGPRRAMRQVLRGRAEGFPGEVVVKWSRAVTAGDRVARALRGGKGPREGRALRRLAAAGIRVPRALAWTDGGTDLLVTAALDGLAPLPPAGAAPPALVGDAASLLGGAWRAGLRHRDLHRGNLGVVDGRAVLVDVGGARFGRGGLVRELGRAVHGVLGEVDARRGLRALTAWIEAARPGTPRAARRALARRAHDAARHIARRYRRGRDRRATRSGRHYEAFGAPGGVRGIRRREAPAAWAAEAGAWIRGGPPGSTPLKAGGAVRRARLAGWPGEVVVKRYGGVLPGRLPRPARAFRRAAWLEHRDLEVPRALLAAWDGRGRGVVVSEHVDAPDLDAGWRAGDLAAPDTRRRVLEAVGRTLRRMHEAGLNHRDLKAPNLLVADAATRPRVLLVDLEGLARHRRDVGWRRRARDLARLDASLPASRTDRLRVLEAYLHGGPPAPVPRAVFAALVVAASDRKRASLARRAARAAPC